MPKAADELTDEQKNTFAERLELLQRNQNAQSITDKNKEEQTFQERIAVQKDTAKLAPPK
jgi:hypothetical protein